jgi:epoxyqueuosine reductase
MIRNVIENHLVPKEDYIYGFADLRGLLPNKYSEFKYGVSIGKKLDDQIIDKLIDSPSLEYFNHYKNINTQLSELTGAIHKDFSVRNITSLPISPTISPDSKDYNEHLKSLSFDISHKMVATRAGLGWIGKTDLLISKEFGPRLRLVTILLKEDPGVDNIPVEKSKCGNCIICVIACPAHAANGRPWNVNLHRDTFFNAFKCREKCGQLAKELLNSDERICGLCVRVCPIGLRRYSK